MITPSAHRLNVNVLLSNGEGSGTLLIQTRPNLVLKFVFGKVNLLCTNFQSVAEINRGSQIFSDASLAQAPANFGPKRCFLET